MRIKSYMINQPTFMAHTYKVEPRNKNIDIRTDNEDHLGKKPYLIYDIKGERQEEEMKKEGNLYYFHDSLGKEPFKYHIEYKDTGKIDLKDGHEYCFNPIPMMQKATVITRLQHRQPLVHTIKEGKAVGRIKYQDSNVFKKNDDITEPTILVVRTFASNLDNPNIVGLIYTTDDIAAFSHLGTRLRQETNVCGAVLEPDKIERLKSLDGENVELELKDNWIWFDKTDKPSKPIEFKTVDVPKLKPCNKILTSKEYSPDIIGAKAVNLRRLEELKEQGKIDVIIPKSMALPSGYLEPMMDNSEDIDDYARLYDEYMSNGEIEKLMDTLKENGINTPAIMVRSSFNGEDLPHYSAAGVYKTCVAQPDDKEDLFDTIRFVVHSKYHHNAEYSRKMYNIPEENIQPGIVLQNRVKPDYKFTLYTDDKKGNLKIELYSDREWRFEGSTQPHIFTYNKDNGKLTYDSIQMNCPKVTFNEDEEIIELEPLKYDLSGNKKLFDQLKKVAQNALVVEQEFCTPQDIEGGIKDDDIYFWQTRNIVDKVE